MKRFHRLVFLRSLSVWLRRLSSELVNGLQDFFLLPGTGPLHNNNKFQNQNFNFFVLCVEFVISVAN